MFKANDMDRIDISKETYTLPNGDSVFVNEFSLSIGEIVVIIGGNGVGKSTFFDFLMAFEEATLSLRTAPVKNPIALVLQNSNNALFPWLKVSKNIFLDATYTEAMQLPAVKAITTTLGLTSLMDRYPFQLSGGQKQLVNIARGLSFQQGPLLLLDEPLSSLDGDYREKVIQLINIEKKKRGIAIIHHGHLPVSLECDRIYQIKDGQLGAISI